MYENSSLPIADLDLKFDIILFIQVSRHPEPFKESSSLYKAAGCNKDRAGVALEHVRFKLYHSTR